MSLISFETFLFLKKIFLSKSEEAYVDTKWNNLPHCSKAFKVDESGYESIVKQVRDSKFEQELHDRLDLAERDKQNAVELAEAKAASELQKNSIVKDTEIQDLKAKLKASEAAQKLAVTEALSVVEKNVTSSQTNLRNQNMISKQPLN